MVRALFDSNILVDYLRGVPQAKAELERHDDKSISVITWMEIMVGATADLEGAIRGFLSDFDVIAVDERIAERAVALRRAHKLKLPDAVIWATAQAQAMLLVTRDTKDFPASDPGIRVPYTLLGSQPLIPPGSPTAKPRSP